MKFLARYPDGREEELLSVPNYKFAWQRQYILNKPLHFPAGTQIIAQGSYDNSAQNPANPDPSKEIGYGPGSEEEMFSGIMYYINMNTSSD